MDTGDLPCSPSFVITTDYVLPCTACALSTPPNYIYGTIPVPVKFDALLPL